MERLLLKTKQYSSHCALTSHVTKIYTSQGSIYTQHHVSSLGIGE